MGHRWVRYWYTSHWMRYVLLPFAWIYQVICAIRRYVLTHYRQTVFPVPVIVVGNISVGGVGKTPLVIALAKALTQKGMRVGIVSRGYGATIRYYPHEVSRTDDPREVGDEPVLIRQKTDCPVVIAPNRVDAVQYLLRQHSIDVVISDDGLQHYAMGRSIEIVVIDGDRGLGNGLCLPAGPLRESAKRLQSVDFVVVNGSMKTQSLTVATYPMILKPGGLVPLRGQQPWNAHATVAAIAGIGHPQRFFSTLRDLGLTFKAYSFPDHHPFKLTDLMLDEEVVVMTEKDAVKCLAFSTERMYVLPVEAVLSDAFWEAFSSHRVFLGKRNA